MRNICILSIIVPALLCLAGCARCPSNATDEMMLPLGDALTKLSTKIESVVRYKHPHADATSSQILAIATSNDPGLLTFFEDYDIRIRTENRHAQVLICSKDGQVGLFEDLGCTAPLDRNLWREHTAMPCVFSLSVAMGCRD